MTTNEEAITNHSTEAGPRRSKRLLQRKIDSEAVEQGEPKEEHREEEIRPKKKRLCRPRKAAKTRGTAEPKVITDDDMEMFVAEPTPPLLLLPPEVLHHVLSFMPTSQVAPLSLVSTRLLEICRSWPRWRTICKVSQLGEPKLKYRSHMALVCSESCYICDLCDGRSTGTGFCGLAGLPLSVSRTDDQDCWWRLCKQCRIKYYEEHPETEDILSTIHPKDEISEYDIIRELKLKHEELYRFDRRSVGYQSFYSRRRFYNPSNYLFNTRDVTEYAMDVHGGWVGVLAARNRYCSHVLETYRLRKRLDQLLPQKKPAIAEA